MNAKPLNPSLASASGLSGVRGRENSLLPVSLLISVALSTLILLLFLAVSEPMGHWFVVPVLMCGALIGMDAVDWFRGKINIFDPFGIVGLLGFHFFFLAPLLHVYWQYWPLYNVANPPDDYRPFLGSMAALNFLG